MSEYYGVSMIAAAALEKGVFVKNSSGEAAQCTADTDAIIGVTLNSAAAGELVTIVTSGLAHVQASAALTAFGEISCDANGRAKDGASGDTIGAIAGNEVGVAASGGKYALVPVTVLARKYTKA